MEEERFHSTVMWFTQNNEKFCKSCNGHTVKAQFVAFFKEITFRLRYALGMRQLLRSIPFLFWDRRNASWGSGDYMLVWHDVSVCVLPVCACDYRAIKAFKKGVLYHGEDCNRGPKNDPPILEPAFLLVNRWPYMTYLLGCLPLAWSIACQLWLNRRVVGAVVQCQNVLQGSQ